MSVQVSFILSHHKNISIGIKEHINWLNVDSVLSPQCSAVHINIWGKKKKKSTKAVCY